MLQNFTKYAGLVQTAIGLLGQFVPGVGSLLGHQQELATSSEEATFLT